jgi:homotetrameric cytidine deaminase
MLGAVSLSSALSPLRRHAQTLLERAHVPFSDEPSAAVLLLDDGGWIPGVRVESASFSLTVPALLNAYTTAVAAGRAEAVVAFVLSRSFRREETVYVEALPHEPYEAWAADAWVRSGAAQNGALPRPDEMLSPVYDGAVADAEAGIREARRLAERAYVPTSHYPVGALLETADGDLVPGVNVEHPDWARILCAERNALGTLRSYAAGPAERLYLSCADDPDGTPCGACRQLLVELAPESVLWMDRHSSSPERADLSTLLPGSFRGRALLPAS